MPAKIGMQILRDSNPTQVWGIVPQPGFQHSRSVVNRTQIPRVANESGGLNNVGMINRVRFAKSGCSSCGGAK